MAWSFYMIPSVVMGDPQLSLGAKVCYGVLLTNATTVEGKTVTDVPVSRIAEAVALHFTSVHRYLRELQDAGLVTTEDDRKGRPALRTLAITPPRPTPSRSARGTPSKIASTTPSEIASTPLADPLGVPLARSLVPPLADSLGVTSATPQTPHRGPGAHTPPELNSDFKRDLRETNTPPTVPPEGGVVVGVAPEPDCPSLPQTNEDLEAWLAKAIPDPMVYYTRLPGLLAAPYPVGWKHQALMIAVVKCGQQNPLVYALACLRRWASDAEKAAREGRKPSEAPWVRELPESPPAGRIGRPRTPEEIAEANAKMAAKYAAMFEGKP